MNILIAPNAFKGSLSAAQAVEAMRRGVLNILPDAHIDVCPVTDGGDGLTDILAQKLRCDLLTMSASDPLGKTRVVNYGFNPENKTAVMDMAVSGGLVLLQEQQRNPELTSSRGLGQMIAHALAQGAEKILVGIGGSATNDGGMGMASELGIRFLDSNEQELAPTGASLIKLAHIDMSSANSRLQDCKIEVICDVDNPLFGPNGAAFIYGPQKGADSAMVERLDKGLQHFADVVEHQLNKRLANIPGAGAAGGLGAGLIAFCNAQLKRGIDVVLDALEFDQYLDKADLVLTGEGCIDEQTVFGKAPAGVAQRAKKFNRPCIAFAGLLQLPQHLWQQTGFDYAISITPNGQALDQAMRCAPDNLTNAVKTVLSDQAILQSVLQ